MSKTLIFNHGGQLTEHDILEEHSDHYVLDGCYSVVFKDTLRTKPHNLKSDGQFFVPTPELQAELKSQQQARLNKLHQSWRPM